MRSIAFILAFFVASGAAFAPTTQTKYSFALNESLFAKIANMDLWAPVSNSNEYGARDKKNLKTGKITEGKSYVPAGLSAAEYNKIRSDAEKKKQEKYTKNVKKAGVFQDYTDFYIKRGTDVSQKWAKSVTKGHDMAKTKYDWSGKQNDAPLWATKGKGKGKK